MRLSCALEIYLAILSWIASKFINDRLHVYLTRSRQARDDLPQQ
jgi:hypothetical protein